MDRSKTTPRHPLRNAHLAWALLSGIGVVIAALVMASSAAGHVTVAPPYLDADRQARVEFETPNERPPHATVSLVIDAPPGFVFAAAARALGDARSVDRRQDNRAEDRGLPASRDGRQSRRAGELSREAALRRHRDRPVERGGDDPSGDRHRG